MTLFFFVLTSLAANAAYNTLVVVVFLSNLVCTDIVLFLPDIFLFMSSLDAVHPIVEKSSDRLVYDEVTEGWESGLFTMFTYSSSSVTSS